jgi:hypothetical protein
MLNDVWTYTVLLFWGWLAVMSGVLATLLAFYERVIRKEDLHLKRYVFILAVFVFIAGFLAWRDEHQASQSLKGELLKLQHDLDEKAKVALPDLRADIGFSAGSYGEGTVFILFGKIKNRGAPSIVERMQLLIDTPNGTLTPYIMPLKKGTILNLPTADGKGGAAVAFNPLAEQAVRDPIQTNGQILGQIIFILPDVRMQDYLNMNPQERLRFVDSNDKEYNVSFPGIRRPLEKVPYIPGMEISPMRPQGHKRGRKKP